MSGQYDRDPIERERLIDAALDNPEAIGPLVTAFYCSRYQSRRNWIGTLAGLTPSAMRILATLAAEYGTASAVELKDAIATLEAEKVRP